LRINLDIGVKIDYILPVVVEGREIGLNKESK